jgi:hypothetical protein
MIALCEYVLYTLFGCAVALARHFRLTKSSNAKNRTDRPRRRLKKRFHTEVLTTDKEDDSISINANCIKVKNDG